MMALVDADAVAQAWRLAPHPEGGFFRETFRSAIAVTPPGWSEPRALATSILYLLPAGARSAVHRVRSDELWLYQSGAAMVLSVGDQEHRVGPDRDCGDELQVLVPGGVWQSSVPAAPASPDLPGWSLVACVVAPGFDFADFEFG
jgi:uncharacterized protein